ncbi:glycoside hydrolase family 95 protein [Paenibacillus sp. XY044]|uniref:glycoside hydrolase family 95 protein n=1 Tax=Paenibacillus sp. XY044 TaxID=2026089 RepID=UPI00211B1191|nr:glycoside hydrolase family 95 protein [Paenibacillus sp. XY044]
MDQSSKRAANKRLWYRKPASVWEEALPIGNGRLGGMVFGGAEEDKIQLNEDTLWSGFPRDTVNYNALRYVEPAKALVAEGRYAEAEALIEAGMLGRRTESYQPLGDLHFAFGRLDHVADYERELDLDQAVTSVSFQTGGVRVVREAFASRPDEVIAVHFRAEPAGSGNPAGKLELPDLSAWLTSPHISEVSAEPASLVLTGQAPSHVADNYLGDHPQSVLYEEGLGLRFAAVLSVRTDGELRAEEGRIRIGKASTVTFVLAAATDFAGFDTIPGASGIDPVSLCREHVNAADRDYPDLRQRHTEDYRELFDRVDLQVGQIRNQQEAEAAMPTDERLLLYRQGKTDLALETLLFHYGRYLMIAGSRPGTQALNLQGIWNPHKQPPWNSNYTTNINAEMNYWPAEVCGLGECHEPLFDLIRELSVTGSRTAAIHYGARGWTAHHNTDLWRMSTPSDGRAMWAFWPMGGVWLTRHLWERYAFRPDAAYLRDVAYPLMKGAALFCLDWLVQLPDGRWTTGLSTSPENVFLTESGEPCSTAAGSAMDMALIDELFGHCIEAAGLLGIDEDLRQELSLRREQLALPGIAPDGRMREWERDFGENEPGHRHVSHLYGVYPGDTLNESTPELLRAASLSLEKRIEAGSGHTGWSASWILNLYARLKEPANVYRSIRRILSDSSLPNLFGNHPPFQIDGNFGYAAGVAEALLQSHLGEIRMLPALPEAWNEGEAKGLRARGGFVLDMKWSAGALKEAKITSTHGGTCRIADSSLYQVQGPDGQVLSATGFAAAADVTYLITPRG